MIKKDLFNTVNRKEVQILLAISVFGLSVSIDLHNFHFFAVHQLFLPFLEFSINHQVPIDGLCIKCTNIEE